MSRRKRIRPSGRHSDLRDRLYPTLDLHGETADGARRRAERWLKEQRAEDAAVVRLITGRGLHSAGPPVLPGEIQHLLEALRPEVVRRFEREPGGAVFRVELARRSTPTHPPAPPPAPSPPRTPEEAELRRLAEESLTDLGITPTPELLRAEIRRLKLRGMSEGGQG